jgi:hypothetical protein
MHASFNDMINRKIARVSFKQMKYIYDKQDLQEKAAFNERNPHKTQ